MKIINEWKLIGELPKNLIDYENGIYDSVTFHYLIDFEKIQMLK